MREIPFAQKIDIDRSLKELAEWRRKTSTGRLIRPVHPIKKLANDAAGAKTREVARVPSFYLRSLFVSDLHLGAGAARAKEFLCFLRALEAETIYLVGDIFDIWQVGRVAPKIQLRVRGLREDPEARLAYRYRHFAPAQTSQPKTKP